MAVVELDLNLTDEQKAMRDLVRKFGAEVARPAAIKLDKLADPQKVIAEDSVLWDVFRTYRQLGLHRRGYPEELGGLGNMDALTGCLIGEEMGYWASDLAISLGAAGNPFRVASLSPHPKVRDLARQYLEDTEAKLIGCWAITEPDHGSDWVLAVAGGSRQPECAPQVSAVKKGDRYILNGQKSAWVSNGTIATHAGLHVCLDRSQGMGGGGLAVVPLDLPGISKGKPLNKLGQRALNQGEIFFDNVELPEEYMVVPNPQVHTMMMPGVLTGANTGMGVTFAGLARAAFDEALAYAKERVQGGKPIIEHQNIQLKLFKMFTMVEAARSFSRRVSAYNAVTMPGSAAHAVASKVLSTETAFMVASEAIQIFGGYGLSKDYHIEKIFRDAKTAMIEDGENSALSLAAAASLV